MIFLAKQYANTWKQSCTCQTGINLWDSTHTAIPMKEIKEQENIQVPAAVLIAPRETWTKSTSEENFFSGSCICLPCSSQWKENEKWAERDSNPQQNITSAEQVPKHQKPLHRWNLNKLDRLQSAVLRTFSNVHFLKIPTFCKNMAYLECRPGRGPDFPMKNRSGCRHPARLRAQKVSRWNLFSSC